MELTLDRVQTHFQEERATKIGKEKKSDVRETVEKHFSQFVQQVYVTRKGTTNDKGKPVAGRDISMEAAAQEFFGSTTKQLLNSLGIFTSTDTLSSAASRLGMSNLNKGTLYQGLTEHTNFGAAQPTNTAGISEAWRFLIPELILAAVRTGYTGAALHPNWIAATQNLPLMKATMPQLLRGNTQISKVNEGANIPMGSVRFGQKSVDVYKVGTGFSLTDELIDQSSLDLVAIFLEEVGVDMWGGADWAAMQVLINGEQPNGGESAPVIGVLDPTKGFQYNDLKRGMTRLTRLGVTPDRIVTSEDDGIDITGIPQFQGYNGESKIANISTVVGVPEKFDLDPFPTPTGQILLLNSKRAMVKLTHRGLLVEDQRNAKNQTNEMYVTDFINFAILKRDARLLIDKTVAISTLGFPAYMNIDALQRSGFRQQ